jgi:hypothetical protein
LLPCSTTIVVLFINPLKFIKMEKIVSGILVSCAENSKPNVNGTMYYNCTVEFQGEQYSAIMYDTVYDRGIIVGSTVNFSVKVTNAETGDVILSVLGAGAKRANANAFGIELPATV